MEAVYSRVLTEDKKYEEMKGTCAREIMAVEHAIKESIYRYHKRNDNLSFFFIAQTHLQPSRRICAGKARQPPTAYFLCAELLRSSVQIRVRG